MSGQSPHQRPGETGPISRSGVMKPGTSAFVESTMNRSTFLAHATKAPRQVGDGQRQLIILVTVMRTLPASVRHERPQRARRGSVGDGDEFEVEGPTVRRSPSATTLRPRSGGAVFAQLRCDECQRESGP